MKRCFKRMTYGEMLALVENAVEAYVSEHELDVHEGDDPEAIEMGRWEWCARWLRRHIANR